VVVLASIRRVNGGAPFGGHGQAIMIFGTGSGVFVGRSPLCGMSCGSLWGWRPVRPADRGDRVWAGQAAIGGGPQAFEQVQPFLLAVPACGQVQGEVPLPWALQAAMLMVTDPIESMIGMCRDHSANVKNWRDGQMTLR
jgi:hypothetical protein